MPRQARAANPSIPQEKAPGQLRPTLIGEVHCFIEGIHATCPGKNGWGRHEHVPAQLRALIAKLWDAEKINQHDVGSIRTTLARGLVHYFQPQLAIWFFSALFIIDERNPPM